MVRALSVAVALVAAVVAARAEDRAAVEGTLFVGDAAPPLRVGKWVQGEPVERFEAGKVYVVEFWATWCGPCIEAIPHLNKLQERYKDQGVVFIGQNVREEGAAAEAKVRRFVGRMGSRMSYRVALDDVPAGADPKEGAMWKGWMAAAAKRGIPCSFVVGRDGRIAWIGHPMSLEEPLAEIVGGAFDPMKDAGGREAQAMERRVEAALDDDPAKALALLDEIERSPDKPEWVDRWRAIALAVKGDYPAFYAAVDAAAAKPGAKAKDIVGMVAMLVNGWARDPDAARALATLDRAMTLEGNDDPAVRARAAVVRLQLMGSKKDRDGAARAAAALAEAPGASAEQLTDAVWRVLWDENLRAIGPDAAMRLVDRAAQSARTPEDQFAVERARLAVGLWKGDGAVATAATTEVLASPEANAETLWRLAAMLAGDVREGPVTRKAVVTLLDRSTELASGADEWEAVRHARFQAMVAVRNLDAAYAAARELADGPDVSAQVLNSVAWNIATSEKIDRRDMDLAERMAARAVAATEEKDGNLIDTLARVVFDKGQIARAVGLQTKALERVHESRRTEFQATLERYKAKLAEGR